MARDALFSQFAPGDRGPRKTPRDRVAISLRGTVNFRSESIREPSEVDVIEWWVRGASQHALLSEHPGPLPPIQPFGQILNETKKNC